MGLIRLKNPGRPADLLVVTVRGGITIRLLAILVACRTAAAQEYQFNNFGTREGLTNLAIRQIFQDREGFLWLSTENGIFRFDGERFDPFGKAKGLPANSGAAMGEAPDGSLLVGGEFGLFRLAAGAFEQIPLNGAEVSWAEGIQSDGKGHTFLGTTAGLMEMSQGRRPGHFAIQRIPRVEGTSEPGTSGILVDGETLWYGCGTELCRRDSRGTRVFGRESHLPKFGILVIRKDGDGNLWLKAKNAGIYVLMKGKDRFKETDAPVPTNALIGVPSVDGSGRILLPSSEGLLIREQTGWRKISRASGLKGTVYSVFEDRQQDLWIGLAGRGLSRWDGYRQWERYTTDSGLPNDLVYEILPRPDNSLWIGTEGGLYQGTRGAHGFSWKQVPGVGNTPVHSVRTAPTGDVWIGTETRGAARIDARTGMVEWFGDSRGLTARAPYTLRFDREGRLWAATDAGLFLSERPYKRFARVADLPATRFWAIAQAANGAIWAGGKDGLFGYFNGNWRKYTKANGLTNQEVISLGAAPDGAVWIGYRFGGGIDRVRPSLTGVAIDQGVQRPGTLGLVYFLEFDAAGHLWAGTEKGVDKWDGYRWSHYDVSDGLAWDDCNLNAFAAEPDGSVWIGTSGGLARFIPRPSPISDTLSNASARVIFTKVALGKKDVSVLRNPSADIQSNTLSARYTILNAPHGGRATFRYRLMPSNSVWMETAQKELEFADVQPGAYNLQVETQNMNGGWSSERAEFPFEIQTPWYRNRWFLALFGLALILAAAFGTRLRMLAARSRELALRRMVEEKTESLRRANEDLLRLSSVDPLTGLANRRLFDVKLAEQCERIAADGAPVSLIFVDIDHFKAINDTEGHQRGDECLVQVAAEMKRRIGSDTALAARYGGEEFAVVLADTSPADAFRFAESLRMAISALALSHTTSPVANVLTVSVGVSTGSREGFQRPDELIAAADSALYRAKRTGRNRVEIADTRLKPTPTPTTSLPAQDVPSRHRD